MQLNTEPSLQLCIAIVCIQLPAQQGFFFLYIMSPVLVALFFAVIKYTTETAIRFDLSHSVNVKLCDG